MRSTSFKGYWVVVFCLILSILVFGCAPMPPRVDKFPPFQGFSGLRWGASIEEAKKWIEAEGKQVFEDRTGQRPYAFYAAGTYLNSPAVFSYFFTPRSKKLYRVDVTLRDLTVHPKAREDLLAKFGPPTYSQPNVDHWSWTDKTVVILQREPDCVQIAYSDGGYAELNYREGNGLRK